MAALVECDDYLNDDYAEREMARRHLRDFIPYQQPDYIVNPFGTMLADVCEEFLAACIAGESPRYMVFAPPQHGKSLCVSRQLPAWALGKYPGLRFVGASYGDTLALEMSRDVQAIMESDAYERVFPHVKLPTKGSGKARRSDEAWRVLEEVEDELELRGGYRARGVGQGLSGFPADPLIIDDPCKDLEDARSPAIRRKVWNWYAGVGLLRVQPGSGVLLMHTRWDMDDLAGSLLELQDKEQGLPWKVISYQAIAEKDEGFRKEGEPLCPHRYDLKALRNIEATVGPFVWSALYQQSPTVAGGDVFEDDWWQYYGAVKPRIVYRLIFGDTAQKTKETNDYSVFQCWGMGVDGRIYLLDQIRDKWKAPELLTQATDFWDKWSPPGKDHEITRTIYIEDKVSGTGLIQQLESREHDPQGRKGAIPVEGIQRHTDKVIRADDGAPQIRAGNVVLPERAEWLSDYKSEFSKFTRQMSHKHDDQIDPTLDAIKTMLTSSVDLYAGAIS